MVKTYIPERGDIVMLNFDPQSGKEQAGLRPALVISPKSYNEKVTLGIFCPITSKVKNYAFEVLLPKNMKIKGVILSDHIKNLDWTSREIKFIETLDKDIFDSVIERIRLLV